MSYYTTDDADAAQSEDLAGISRTTVSAGFIRQIAGIAHSVWPLLPEKIVEGPATSTVVDLDPTAVLTGAQTVTEEEFLAIIRRDISVALSATWDCIPLARRLPCRCRRHLADRNGT